MPGGGGQIAFDTTYGNVRCFDNSICRKNRYDTQHYISKTINRAKKLEATYVRKAQARGQSKPERYIPTDRDHLPFAWLTTDIYTTPSTAAVNWHIYQYWHTYIWSTDVLGTRKREKKNWRGNRQQTPSHHHTYDTINNISNCLVLPVFTWIPPGIYVSIYEQCHSLHGVNSRTVICLVIVKTEATGCVALSLGTTCISACPYI